MSDAISNETFEHTLAELETIVEEMEKGDLPLHVALEKFEKGIKLSKLSQQALDKAQQKVQILLSENADAQLTDYTPDNQ